MAEVFFFRIFVLNNYISYKTLLLFFLQKIENREHNLRFRRDGRPFFSTELG